MAVIFGMPARDARARALRVFGAGLCFVLGSAACSRAESLPGNGQQQTLACKPVSISTLPDVSVHFLASDCSFSLAEAAAGIAIPYEVVIAADVPGVVPEAQDAGQCETPEASGLIWHAVLSGGSERYCLCDVGLCAGNPFPAVTLAHGTYPATFDWHGENWTGPSDTGQPKGAPFPAGSYELTVSATGTVSVGGTPQVFDVTGRLPIALTP